jgi:hypothetical protein
LPFYSIRTYSSGCQAGSGFLWEEALVVGILAVEATMRASVLPLFVLFFVARDAGA